MKLALSGRLWETSQGYTSTLLEQIGHAAKLGYQGIEARYPVIPPREEWDVVTSTLAQHNIELVFAPGGGVPSTPEKREDLIRVLDFLKHCGAPFLKQIPTGENDHDAMRLAADLGAERGIRVLSQYHSNSLTDTVEKTEKFFQTLEHPNLGLIWDSCHIPFSDTVSIEEAIERLWQWIELVNLQSYKPSTPDDGLQHAAINGREWSTALPDDPTGTDLKTTIEVLKQRGYDGWLVVMPAVDPTMQAVDVARAYRDFLNPII
jgi:sugar phosphate isomerase/epimerase